MIRLFKRAWGYISRLFKKEDPVIIRPIEPIDPVKPEPKKTPNARILEVAESLKGKVQEIPGKNHNPIILEMFRVVDGKEHSDETPWCAVAVGYVLNKVGLDHTGSMLARSYVNYGKEVKPEDIRKGDIVVFKRGNSSWKGHVGFFYGYTTPGKYDVLGGNQNNAFNVKQYSLGDLLSIRRAEDKKPDIEYRERINHFSGYDLSKEFYSLLNELSGELAELEPKDVGEYFPNYFISDSETRADFWKFFLSCMAKKESNINPKATFKESFRVTYGPRRGKRVLSSGLFQISIDSINGYVKHGGKRVNSQDQLFSDWFNLELSVFVLKHWINRDGVISGFNPPRGGSRYWSVLRDNKNHNWIKKQCLENFAI